MSHLLPFPPQTSSRHPLVRMHMGLWFVFFLALLLNSIKHTAIPACWGCALKTRFGVCAALLSAGIEPPAQGLRSPGWERVCSWLLEWEKHQGLACVWFKLRALEHFVGRKANIKNPDKFANSCKGEGQWGGSSATLTISFWIMLVV